MEGGIQSQLDTLSQNGILNFDADAYVKGTSPRYAGELPKQYLPFDRPLGCYPTQPMLLPPGTKLPEQAKTDEMVKNGNEPKKTSTWKKVLFGLLGVGLIIGGGYKIAKSKSHKLGKVTEDVAEDTKKSGIIKRFMEAIGKKIR